MKHKYNSRRKFWQGTLGIILTGAGLCCLIECGFLKHGGEPATTWVTYGTLSLILFMTGFVLSIDSIRYGGNV
jgi:hypothetical protein